VLRSRPSTKRECGGSEHRSSEALHGPEGDERLVGPRKPAEQGTDREEGQSGEEQSPPAEEVGEPSTEQKRAAEHDRVRGDDPLKARLREAQVDLDRGQGDIDDRDVQDDHELRRHDQREGTPASILPFTHRACAPG
jgi:hypothetical protein